jgi:hypothetical protein
VLWSAIGAGVAAGADPGAGPAPGQRRLTQEDIDACGPQDAGNHHTCHRPPRAGYENIRPSVVRVVSYVKKSRLKEKEAKHAKAGVAPAKPAPGGPKIARPTSAPSDKDSGADDDEVETAWAPAW